MCLITSKPDSMQHMPTIAVMGGFGVFKKPNARHAMKVVLLAMTMAGIVPSAITATNGIGEDTNMT
jgi:hypothetical protein